MSLTDPRSQLETRCFTQFTTAGQVAYTTSECWKTHFKNKSANKQSTILGLAVRQHGRQKAVVDTLHGLDFTISNKQCLNWETAPGNAVLDNAIAHDGYFVPPGTQKSILACFHINNAVFTTDALDGESTVDTLMMSGFQRKYPIFKFSHSMLIKVAHLKLSRRILTTRHDVTTTPSWRHEIHN